LIYKKWNFTHWKIQGVMQLNWRKLVIDMYIHDTEWRTCRWYSAEILCAGNIVSDTWYMIHDKKFMMKD
jgi:hypothetical protein